MNLDKKTCFLKIIWTNRKQFVIIGIKRLVTPLYVKGKGDAHNER